MRKNAARKILDQNDKSSLKLLSSNNPLSNKRTNKLLASHANDNKIASNLLLKNERLMRNFKGKMDSMRNDTKFNFEKPNGWVHYSKLK